MSTITLPHLPIPGQIKRSTLMEEGMLQLQGSVRAVELESCAPPEISAEQAARGGHALRKLKEYCDKMYELNKKYILDYTLLEKRLEKLASEKENMTVELAEKNDRIARLRQRENEEMRFTRSQEEAERLLMEETLRRINTEKHNQELKVAVQNAIKQYEDYKASVSHEEQQREARERLLEERAQMIEELNGNMSDLQYRVDELKVATIKYERRQDDLEKALLSATQKVEQLTQSESVLREENTQLQKRLRELLDANKEVTANYQIVKKNYDLKRHEYDELTLELEDAKAACQLAVRNKKQLQTELISVTKTRNEFAERIKSLEGVLSRKEKDIADLLNKINETISDYELKLERKEEQIWAMSMQLSEETQKNHAAQQAAEKAKQSAPAPQQHHVNIDADILSDFEKKWQAKEKVLADEIERMKSEIKDREELITKLESQVGDLRTKQFHPRMERLKTIEKDIKNRMEEYALAEERMEVGFICPRDLSFFKVPVTLIPCGHTFCKGCYDAMKEETYTSQIKCEVCNSVAEGYYRNEQVERIAEQFSRRKHLTLSFLEWIKTLKVYLPNDE